MSALPRPPVAKAEEAMNTTDIGNMKRDIGVAFESIQSRLRKIESVLVLIQEQGHVRYDPVDELTRQGATQTEPKG